MADVVIGVDPSSKSMHAVVTVDGVPTVHYIPLHKTDKTLANAQAFKWASELVREHPMDDVYVFVELPVMGRAGAHTMLVIGKAIGAVEAAAVLGGAKVIEVNNMTWKSKVIGGRVGKPEIKAYVKRAWPTVYELADGNQDLCDAACINLYGQKVLGISRRGPSMPKRRVIRKRRK